MRKWAKRVKGRDYYDFVWTIARNIPIRLKHLEARLRQSGGWVSKEELTPGALKKLLQKKFSELDVEAAKRDAEPFLKDKAATTLWSRKFFVSLLSKIETA